MGVVGWHHGLMRHQLTGPLPHRAEAVHAVDGRDAAGVARGVDAGRGGRVLGRRVEPRLFEPAGVPPEDAGGRLADVLVARGHGERGVEEDPNRQPRPTLGQLDGLRGCSLKPPPPDVRLSKRII